MPIWQPTGEAADAARSAAPRWRCPHLPAGGLIDCRPPHCMESRIFGLTRNAEEEKVAQGENADWVSFPRRRGKGETS